MQSYSSTIITKLSECNIVTIGTENSRKSKLLLYGEGRINKVKLPNKCAIPAHGEPQDIISITENRHSNGLLQELLIATGACMSCKVRPLCKVFDIYFEDNIAVFQEI